MTTLTTTSTGAAAAPAGPRSRAGGLRWGDFGAGLPALGLGLALAGLVGLHRYGRPADARYTAEATRRFDAKDYEGALVCYKRLAAIHPERPALRFSMAVLLERVGKGANAEALARSIAPLKGQGFPPAYLFLVRRLLQDRAQLPRVAPLVEAYLKRYLQYLPKSGEAQSLLGGLYAAANHSREARPLLESSAGDHPERLLDLARVCLSLGDRDAALRHARHAAASAQARAEAKPDDVPARLFWADALALAGDEAAALDVLDGGGEPIFRRAAVGACLARTVALARQGPSTAPARMAMIERGLRNDPLNPALLDQLGGVMAAGGPAAEKARATARAAMADAKTPAAAPFVLGNDAYSHGDAAEARKLWEKAHALDPAAPVVTNNLAWILAYTDPPEPDRALTLIGEAVTRAPKDPRLRGTKGQILAKLGRWSEARADMESAVADGEKTASLRESLAKVYDQLGQPDKAAALRNLEPSAAGPAAPGPALGPTPGPAAAPPPKR